MKRQALTEKILVLGIDGFEPRLAKKYLDSGHMPNLQTFQARGASREDLILLGSMPTVTPPLWTTLATGTNPGTHGITCFFRQDPDNLDAILFNLDSRYCRSEPIWNAFIEAGKRTLIWHWPGSSWPPTSDSPLLSVVDGVQPITVNAGIATVDTVKIIGAAEKYETLEFMPNTAHLPEGTGCIINDADSVLDASENDFKAALRTGKTLHNFVMTAEDCEVNTIGVTLADTVKSPIRPASGWADAPQDAKEFVIIVSSSLLRKPALLLKNEQGIYDTIAVYRSKKDRTPIVTLHNGETKYAVLDECIKEDGTTVKVGRNYQALEIAPDGHYVNLLLDLAIEDGRDELFHPRDLFQEVRQKFGPIPTRSGLSGIKINVVESTVIPAWENYCTWQADVLTNFMAENKFDVIFSHIHNVDSMGHYFWHYAKHFEHWQNDAERYQKAMQSVYEQTDRYIGRFLPYLDEGWTIIITSDHGLICSENHGIVLGEMAGVNVGVMSELGYTVMKKDENGQMLREIDWDQTRAVQVRGGHIYINLKGRDKHGIVDPSEKYELEQQLISDLYNYRDPQTGKRVVAVALRNKDAILLGMNGPECGDIIFLKEEGFNVIHADSLSTQYGYADTSVSPIFLAAGPGIKENFRTKRIIRQIDVAPTLAVLGGVRIPDDCEGAPIYSIFSKSL